jgi:hypothetical protein
MWTGRPPVTADLRRRGDTGPPMLSFGFMNTIARNHCLALRGYGSDSDLRMADCQPRLQPQRSGQLLLRSSEGFAGAVHARRGQPLQRWVGRRDHCLSLRSCGSQARGKARPDFAPPCVIRATGLGCLRTRRMPSRRILRAVRTFGNGDKVPGIVAVQATAAHHVGRDLLLRSAHSKFTANQMTGHDCGLG